MLKRFKYYGPFLIIGLRHIKIEVVAFAVGYEDDGGIIQPRGIHIAERMIGKVYAF